MGRTVIRASAKTLSLSLTLAATLFAAPAWSEDAADAGKAVNVQAGNVKAGERLYRHGLTHDGSPVEAVTQGDVAVQGEAFACAACHRPSGFGSSEGGTYVPPITSDFLFGASQFDRKKRNERFKELFKEAQPNSFWSRVRQARARPAYDRESLGRALREGVDPAGRELHRLMPRYRLDDRDVANLTAYLRTLSAEIDPGVGEDKIHFATVVTPEAKPARREAFLHTVRTFADWMNEDTANDQRFPDFSPYYRSEFLHAYRLWDIHVWELEGPPETWRAQLEAKYAEQPVFAVISGLSPEPWAPVADFCDSEDLPCLLPHTPLPRTADAEGAYSLYFNRGLALQGEVAAEALRDGLDSAAAPRQIHIAGPQGRTPARALANAWGEGAWGEGTSEADASTLTTQRVADGKALAAAVRDAAAADSTRPLAIWPGDSADDVVAALNAAGAEAGQTEAGEAALPPVVLPDSALDAVRGALDPVWHDKLRVVWPYEVPGAYHPRRFRIRAWFNTRGIPIKAPRMQLNTYYALTMIQYSLGHMIDDFHRDYMIEIIEHEAENRLNPGTFPKLALGPGQRFASKGAYMVAPDPEAKDGYRPVSDWIVP